jgi:CBS domain containing-hemolysin-like protein
MFDWLAIVVIAGVYASEYVVSLYSLAVYIDPEDVHVIFPNVSRREREFLKRLVANPRAFIQIATVYKSLALITVVVLATFVFDSISRSTALSAYYVYPVGYIIVWLLQVFCVEYLARRTSRRAIRNRMPKNLWLITLIYFLLYPVVAVYRRLLNRVRQGDHVTEEEKEDIVERAIETLADQAGIGETIVEEDEKEMIGRIFLLDQTVVREIMVPRIDITGIEKSMSVKKIQDLVLADGHSRFPVYEENIDRVIGILYVKDLFSNMPGPDERFEMASYLRRPYFVPESKIIGELLKEFQARKLHLAMVVDEYGGVAGLVTLEDILEEVFGEIQDEHDTETAEFTRLPDGRYLADASMMVEKLQDYFETEYDQEDYDTIGGLIYDLVGSVPKEGSVVKWHDITFEVTSVEGQRIKTVRLDRHKRNGNGSGQKEQNGD